MIRFDNHAFKGLDASLKRLYELIEAMGDGVESLMGMLPDALESASEDTFQQAKAIDKTINNAEMEVDLTVTNMINRFTIAGEDLRFILTCLKIAGTLERTADKIKNCAKRLSRIEQTLEADMKEPLSTAINAVRTMVPLALELVIDYQKPEVKTLLTHGGVVQNAYRAIVVRTHDHNYAAADETHLLMVAKNLEQASDMLIEVMKLSHYVHFGTKYSKASAEAEATQGAAS